MLVVGLTGGIACGKSTVSRRFQEHHKIPVVDADKIAREVVEPGEPAYDAIVNHFGEDVLKANGELNREALGKKVFGNPKELKILNNITHPAIRKSILRQILLNYIYGYSICILDIPLLFESKLDIICGVTISVICNEKLQIERLLARNPTLSSEDAKNRIDSQMKMNDRIEKSDYIITNDEDMNMLYKRVDNVVSKIQPTFYRTIFEWMPPFGIISALCVILTRKLRKKSSVH
ncbi:hypothetical protein TBLA_0H03250 [Henningerozyma blattae CBS 6284]|uniref:Dephospho-CoA kinase n=1 Tax=Henningerozyma blattae (strain ATCC 34711 / CBS 6284 / DSM 70876 / NBRC 10599 / NRRL Y-10934 / UCD 77-7) TaxID=1071380 RepID=I2H8A4_HENB6|nr:hypothetical protein TBLA_0H03250 [Tetrapisispora blattae CBS 6284]CCH62606.1 hypothetical protein TBLA_0H03250 [Tetrapisispora blattae CBS 6284]